MSNYFGKVMEDGRGATYAGQLITAGIGAIKFAGAGAVGAVAGVGVKEGISHLSEHWQRPERFNELRLALDDAQGFVVLHRLDELADVPPADDDGMRNFHDRYHTLCEVLADINFLFAHTAERRVFRNRRKPTLPDVKKLTTRLKEALKNLAPLPRVSMPWCCYQPQNVLEPKPLAELRQMANNGISEWQKGREGIIESNRIDLDSMVDLFEAVRNRLNIGLVGMGGIGKSAIAHALFQRAQEDRAMVTVWLSVGRRDVVTLLRIAAVQVIDQCVGPCKGDEWSFPPSAPEMLGLIMYILSEFNTAAFLVLDDVWLQNGYSVVKELNFATQRGYGHQKRGWLIVTTRQRATLKHHGLSNRGQPTVEDIPYLKVIQVPFLSDTEAVWVFYEQMHRKLELPGSSRETLPQQLKASFPEDQELCSLLHCQCAGLPELVCAFSNEMFRARHQPAADRWRVGFEAWLDDPQKFEAAVNCRRSVEALPPSLRECFMSFAAFPSNEEVPEQTLKCLFATHMPLHTDKTMKAAQDKLDELVQHSLVHKVVEDAGQGRVLYKMHPMVHAKAKEMAANEGRTDSIEWGSHRFNLCTDRDEHILCQEARDRARYISCHSQCQLSAILPEFEGCRRARLPILTACIIHEVQGQHPTPDPCWPPRMRFLQIGGQVSVNWNGVDKNMLGSLPTLNSLCMSNCTVAASVSVLHCLLPSLQLIHLSLDRCTELRKLPVGLCGCSRLASLEVKDCSRITSLPDRDRTWGCLTDLVVNRCRILTSLGSLESCTKLTRLKISGCSRLRSIPDSIKYCAALQDLEVEGCEVIECLPCEMWRCSALVQFNVRQCTRLTALPREMNRFRQLKVLDVRECHRLKEIPEAIGDCTQMEVMSVVNCSRLMQLGSLNSCRQLTSLNISGCTLLRQIPDNISQCTALQNLDMAECTAILNLPQDMSSCTALVKLNMKGCTRLEELPMQMHAFRKLEVLDVSDCQALTVIPPSICCCHKLELLNLCNCTGLRSLPACILSAVMGNRLRRIVASGCSNWNGLSGFAPFMGRGASLTLDLPEHLQAGVP